MKSVLCHSPKDIGRFFDSREKVVVIELQAHGLRFKDVQGAKGVIEVGVEELIFQLKALDLGLKEA
jgi:hypothetical protein